MPTSKTRIQTIVTQENYEKIKVLCEKEHRTESNLVSMIIDKYIEEYEARNGKITIKED